MVCCTEQDYFADHLMVSYPRCPLSVCCHHAAVSLPPWQWHQSSCPTDLWSAALTFKCKQCLYSYCYGILFVFTYSQQNCLSCFCYVTTRNKSECYNFLESKYGLLHKVAKTKQSLCYHKVTTTAAWKHTAWTSSGHPGLDFDFKLITYM